MSSQVPDEERRDRQLGEFLQGLRVVLPGVQVLFAFLLTVPFSQRFESLSRFQRDVYFATLMATAGATALLIAPAAIHRMRFHRRDRRFIVEFGNRLAIAGLALLALAIVGAVLLIAHVLFGLAAATLFSTITGLVVIGLWFALPVLRGMTRDP